MSSIPYVELTPAQKERAYQMKARWERPSTTLLVPITLTQYIVYLEDLMHDLTFEHKDTTKFEWARARAAELLRESSAPTVGVQEK